MAFYPPSSGPNAVIAFNPGSSGSVIGQVTLPRALGQTFIRLDIPVSAQAIQIRILPDLVIAGAPELGLESLINEAQFDVKLYREVEPGQFLLDTPFSRRFIDDPYLPGRDPDRIMEFDFQVTASTRDPHSALLGRGAFFLVIEGKAAEYLPGDILSGRIAIEVSTDRAGPLGGDPRAQLWGPDWLQPYGSTNPTPGAGAQTVTGGPGADQIFGGAFSDTLNGAGGADYVRGGAGNDSIRGGDAFDDVHGNEGDDTVSGDAHDDWVVGGKGDDALFGGDGADVVLGNLGADTCDGGAGNDTVRGGQDDDVVRGGAGADYVSGDRGSDTVTGGAGADTFHSFGEAGLDRVTDFNRAEGDVVRLDPGTQYTVTQVGSDVVIAMAGGGQMVLAGASLSALSSGWIIVG